MPAAEEKGELRGTAKASSLPEEPGGRTAMALREKQPPAMAVRGGAASGRGGGTVCGAGAASGGPGAGEAPLLPACPPSRLAAVSAGDGEGKGGSAPAAASLPPRAPCGGGRHVAAGDGGRRRGGGGDK